jgi:pilus assembly protein Flp/PilA
MSAMKAPHPRKIMLDRVKQFLADETAATAIEYALIASLVSLVITAALNNLSVKLKNTFNEIAGNLK